MMYEPRRKSAVYRRARLSRVERRYLEFERVFTADARKWAQRTSTEIDRFAAAVNKALRAAR